MIPKPSATSQLPTACSMPALSLFSALATKRFSGWWSFGQTLFPPETIGNIWSNRWIPNFRALRLRFQRMAREPTYREARTAAKTVEAHFARHFALATDSGELDLAPAPDACTIEAIIDATFWASFRPEEGRFPKISLAFLPPEQAGHPLMFETRLPVSSDILTKLAPAVERPGVHLGVWREGKELYVWGATRRIPSLGFVLEDVEPGLLVIKHRRIEGFGKFANVAVLKGEQTKMVDEKAASLPECPDLHEALRAFTSP